VEVICANIDRTKFRYFLFSFDDQQVVANGHPREETHRCISAASLLIHTEIVSACSHYKMTVCSKFDKFTEVQIDKYLQTQTRHLKKYLIFIIQFVFFFSGRSLGFRPYFLSDIILKL
jgi:hypothetical protein